MKHKHANSTPAFPTSGSHAANRHGFTILEVVISMGIAIFGLLAVLAIVPLAARQSKKGLDLDDATTLGHRAIREIEVRGMTDPNRWGFADPVTGGLRSYSAFNFVYHQSGASLRSDPYSRFFWDEAVLLDPMMADPGPLGNYADRMRFPYTYQFASNTNGFDVAGRRFPFRTPLASDPTSVAPMYCLRENGDPEAVGPGVRRVSLMGPGGAMLPAALLEIFDSKDDVQITSRQIGGGEEAIAIQFDAAGKVIASGETSWVAMMVPQNWQRTQWKLFVIVIKERDPLRETDGNLENEREAIIPPGASSLGLARLEPWGTTTVNAGGVGPDVALETMTGDLDYQAGDWVLLSQFRPYTNSNGDVVVPVSAQLPISQFPNRLPYRRVYEWYRVVDVSNVDSGASQFPANSGAIVPWRWVSLQGPDWDFSQPTLVSSFRGVKAVYERSFTMPDGALPAPTPMP